jgi:hypothetical protein
MTKWATPRPTSGTITNDQGAVTNGHSKHAVKRPNGLLEGHREDMDITKKQNDVRDPFRAKSSKTTDLTPTHEGGAFGDHCKKKS